MAKVLYVTNCWSGFIDIYSSGLKEHSGMPGFVLPLKRLVEDGHQIKIIVLHKKIAKNIKTDWLKKVDIQFLSPKYKILTIYKLRKIIKASKPNFVYSHGSLPAFCTILALYNLYIPFAIRLYGTFLVNYIQKNHFLAIMKFPYEIVAFNSLCKFIMITNDGTKGNLVYKKFCYRKNINKLIFWENGVSKFSILNYKNFINNNKNDTINICYPARYDPWKRQDKVLQFASILINRGYDINVTFCGHIYDLKYYNSLVSYSDKLNIKKYVTFEKQLSKSDLNHLIISSDVVPFFYDYSNYGNVFIECCLLGSFIIVLDDSSTHSFTAGNDVCVLVKDEIEAVEKFIYYFNNPSMINTIKSRCMEHASIYFEHWNTRVNKEISLLSNYFNG